MARKRKTPTSPVIRSEALMGRETTPFDDVRIAMLNASGFNVAMLVKVRESVEAALSSYRKTYAMHEGVIGDERSDPDFANILRASELLLKLHQLLTPAPSAKSGGEVSIKIELPDWARRNQGATVIDVTPEPLSS